MLTINNVLILRNTDLKRFFNIEEFWIQREEFFDLVKIRTLDTFFDSEKEKECFSLFYIWCTQGGDAIAAKIQNNVLHVRVNDKDKEYQLGRLASFILSSANILSMKERLGITFLYLMLCAEEKNSDIEIRYEYFVTRKENENGIPTGEFIMCYEDWNVPSVELSIPMVRKIIANKSSHSIVISSGKQTEILNPQECIVGIFNSKGCYRLLPHHIVSPDGGLQLRLVCGDNCANLEMHQVNNVEIIPDVKSIMLEGGNAVVYLQNNGELICDERCFEIKSKYKAFSHHFDRSSLIAIERYNGQIYFYTSHNLPY